MESARDWTSVAGGLVRSLARPIPKRKHDLLAKVLREWARTDLREHLSRESRTATLQRIKKLESVRGRARDLQHALRAVKGDNRTALVAQIMMTQGQSPHEFRQAEFRQKLTQLDEHSRFLAELSGISPKAFWKRGPGQPPNLKAYLVLLDAADIYEWVAAEPARREVDRGNARDSGPFFRFASILWPTIFGNGTAGLKAAMKNWAAWRKEHDERSALIANIALRHPSWRLFERQ